MSNQEDWRDLRFTPHPPKLRKSPRADSIRDELARKRSEFFTCSRHGWDAKGVPCPKCKTDAPTHCSKHGWSATGIPCPKCQKGEP